VNAAAGGFRSGLVPALFTALVVLVCSGLGVWQLERLQWKRHLIAERQAAVRAAPVAAPHSLAEARSLAFHPVYVEGTFLHDKEIDLGATGPQGGTPGFQILTPLQRPDGRIVFVNRGFVPSELRKPEKRSAGQLSGSVRISGLLRIPSGKPGWLVPDNRPDLNYWFWVDVPAMAKAAGLDHVAPFYIDADASPNPGGWPKGGVTRLELPNDHLQYAITWFALAAAALAVFGVWQYQAHRRGER
jgi:surfeit locus 1 family protein